MDEGVLFAWVPIPNTRLPLTDEIVGAHMVGARSGEMLGEMALAMQHNLTLNDILATIHAYPTMNTGIQQAVFEAYLEGEALANNRKLVRTVLSVRG